MPAVGQPYDTGTISVANGATIVYGIGVLWADFVDGLDTLIAGGMVGIVKEVNAGFDEITLWKPWVGSTLTNAVYVLNRDSPFRTDTKYNQIKLRDLLARLGSTGVLYNVSGSVPDPDLGSDGDFAIKYNAGVWTLWRKDGLTWTLLGNPLGFTFTGAWSSVTAYQVGNVVSRLGKTYIAKTVNTNHAPESNPSDWDVLIGSSGRYDIAWSDSGRPASDETVIKFIFTVAATFYAGLSESRGKSDVAATASAVFSLKKNGTQFGTMTFALGATTATFAAASDTSFAIGDVFSIVAPNPRDATLSGVAATVTAYR